MTRNIGKKIKISYLILLFLTSFLILSLIPNTDNNTGNIIIENTDRKDDNLSQKQENPKVSLPTSDYDWWNSSWYYRIPIEISSGGDQQDAPVELQINFTEYFKDADIENPYLDNESIRVIEYFSESLYVQINCEFEELVRSYDAQTNAIGDVVWILNETTLAGEIREFFIYFNNGTDSGVPLYEKNLRIWHEGFEEYRSGDILSVSGQDSHPNSWEISNSISARGSSSLHIWGNTWKARSTNNALFDNTNNPNARVTAKMRFDDPTPPQREVSGLGFNYRYTWYPSSSEFYNIRGNQDWGNDLYRNLYYSPSTFFWYTFEDIRHDQYVIFIGDDDTYTERQLYWDDISAWDYAVQTDPEYMLSITTGDIEVIDFMLQVFAKDENGKPVPNADIYMTSDTWPTLNQYEMSDNNGKVQFSDINQLDIYNITINYTQIGVPDPITETVYFQKNYQIIEIDSIITAYLNLTTFEFNISYHNGDPLKYGFVYLKDGAIIVGKGVLNEIGNTTLRWINDTSYDYDVYFDSTTLPYTASYLNDYLKLTDTPPVPGPYINFISDLYNITFNVTEFLDKTPFLGAKLRIYNETNDYSTSTTNANITVQASGFASFISFRTGYKDWKNYTITAYYGGLNRDFDWERNGYFEEYYNFTLESKALVDLRINLDKELFRTKIQVINYTEESLWSTDFSFIFNFTRQGFGEPLPTLDTPDEISVQIFDTDEIAVTQVIDILTDIDQISEGVFNYTFNTKQFGLIGGTSYYIEFKASYQSYLPDDFSVQFEVLALPASITFHDYETLSQISSLSEYFDELVNVTIKYFSDDTGDPLLGATLSYEGDFGESPIEQDPINPDYYTFTIDMGYLGSTGYNKKINIYASYENYTSYGPVELDVDILKRITTLDNALIPFPRSYNIYIEQDFNLSFIYKDYLSGAILGDLDEASYKPFFVEPNGGHTSLSEYPKNLILKQDNSYLLDFDTENRGLGTYLLEVKFEKSNYESQSIFITYYIILRSFESDLSAKGLEDDQINIVKGDKVTIKVELSDTSQGGIPLRGAEVLLDLGDDELDFDEVEPGVYELEFDTDDYEAFFTSQTLTGDIIITKLNYITEEIELTIVIEMEEIMPGIPTFYFIMVVSGIAAVVGSLVGYRIIQFVRIPKFVKKTRGMKKAIKSSSSISESLLSDSKEETIFKLWGDDWDKIGLSLEDILEFKGKKKGGNI